MSTLSIQTNASLAGESATRRAASGILSLEALWQRHARQVYTLALRLLGEVNEAEVITAEVFKRASQQIPNLPGDERRFLLELTIARSLAWLHKQQRLYVPSDSAPPLSAIPSQTAHQSAFPDSVELENHLLQLPDSLRVVFVLRDGMGLSHKEIAAYLRTDEAQVRQIVHRARLVLRNSLQERHK